MTNFFLVSEEVSFNIFSYLINEDQIALISCDQFFHQRWMQKFRMINLHAPLSELFFIDKQFRQTILSKIHDPSLQLSLLQFPLSKTQGRCTIEDIDESFHVSGLHKLEVDCEVFDYLMGKADSHGIVKIEHLFVKDFPHLLSFHKYPLNVSYLRKVTRSLYLDRPTLTDSLENDLSPSLTELALYHCKVKKASEEEDEGVVEEEEEEEDDEESELLFLPVLPNLKKLILEDTFIGNLEKFHHLNNLFVNIDDEMIEDHDLIRFQHIPNLSIECCDELVDISSLQENDSITIGVCTNVIDYSRCLTKSRIITLRFSREMLSILLDISVFSLVEKLTIDFGYGNINKNQISSNSISPTLKDVTLQRLSFGIDLNLFQSVKFIKLQLCSAIKSLQGLKNVERVILAENNELISLEGLGGNKEVEVISCSKITDFSSIHFVPKVQIELCKGFTNAEDVAEVYDLTIISCSQLKDISSLRKVHTLTVKSCPQITTIKELQSVVPILKISNCKALRKYEAPPYFDPEIRYLKSRNGLERIPDCVYGEVFEYLTCKERINFISTSSYLHHILMKKTRQIMIMKLTSLQSFFTSPTYLNTILEKIENPLKQLQVIALAHLEKSVVRSDFYCPAYQRLELITDFFFELCQNRTNVSSSSSSHGLVSEGNDWKVFHLEISTGEKVSFQEIEPYLYKAVGFLSLYMDEQITSLDHFSPSLEKLHIRNSEETVLILPPLPKLKILSISYCTIKNLSDFHYLQELYLREIAITDVTPFQTIPKIVFNQCDQLQNISPLQSHQLVEFRFCAGLTEYRNTLTRCKEIVIKCDANRKVFIDLSHFQCAKRIRLCLSKMEQNIMISHGMPKLREIELIGNVRFDSNFSGFHGLQRVILQSCSFESLAGFGLSSVREVVIFRLKHLTSLEGLQLQQGNEAVNRSVRINKCPKITDFTPLNYLHKVSINGCDGFRNAAEVDHVHELLISDCSNLCDISTLRNIPKLCIRNCKRVEARQHRLFVAFSRIFT